MRAAGELFSQKGFYGTSIRDIASARGIRSGSLYAHIDSKEDLLFEVVMAGAAAFIDALAPIVEGSGSAEEKLVAGLTAHINVVATHLETSRVFLHEWLLLSHARRELIQQQRDRYEAMWTEILQSGVDEGLFAPISLRYARLIVLSVANWVYLWYDPQGPPWKPNYPTGIKSAPKKLAPRCGVNEWDSPLDVDWARGDGKLT